jgi:ATP phosphoribosyltransferase
VRNGNVPCGFPLDTARNIGTFRPLFHMSRTESTPSSPARVRLGLPKGSLQEPTLALFARAGWNISVGSRSYKPSVDDSTLEIRLLRAQEVSRYVEHGFLDAGITGKDWIAENQSDIEVIGDLAFSRATAQPARWVIAVPNESPVQSVRDLQGRRIATEAVGLVTRFLASHGVTADVEFSWGATEAKVPELVDAIVDITETGSSLRANNLRIVATVMESYPQFIANRAAWNDPARRSRLSDIMLLLVGALHARSKVGIKLNVPENTLPSLLSALPSLRNPTVSRLASEGWLAIDTVIDETIVRELIPQLKALGAEGIIEYPLNKVVY